MPQLQVYQPCIEFDLTYKYPTILYCGNKYKGHNQLLILFEVYTKGQELTLKGKIHFEVLQALS